MTLPFPRSPRLNLPQAWLLDLQHTHQLQCQNPSFCTCTPYPLPPPLWWKPLSGRCVAASLVHPLPSLLLTWLSSLWPPSIPTHVTRLAVTWASVFFPHMPLLSSILAAFSSFRSQFNLTAPSLTTSSKIVPAPPCPENRCCIEAMMRTKQECLKHLVAKAEWACLLLFTAHLWSLFVVISLSWFCGNEGSPLHQAAVSQTILCERAKEVRNNSSQNNPYLASSCSEQLDAFSEPESICLYTNKRRETKHIEIH